MELAADNMWPLALLVFFASITVPVLKLVGLSYLLITGERGVTAAGCGTDGVLPHRRFHRPLVDDRCVHDLDPHALVRMGRLASVIPGPGVLSFCAVVILTMLAAMSFDPRVMWDNAGRQQVGRWRTQRGSTAPDAEAAIAGAPAE